MTIRALRFIPWAVVFGLGATVGAIVVQNLNPALPETQISTANTSLTSANGNIFDSKFKAEVVAGSAPTVGILPPEFEKRLYAHVASVVKTAITEALANQTPTISTAPAAVGKGTVNLTDSQTQVFEGLRARLQDTVKNHNLTWQQLVSAPEMAQLPPAWRVKILNQAGEMLNRGELVPAQFLGAQQ